MSTIGSRRYVVGSEDGMALPRYGPVHDYIKAGTPGTFHRLVALRCHGAVVVNAGCPMVSRLLRALRAFVRERIGVFNAVLATRVAQSPLRAALAVVAKRSTRDPGLVAFGAESNRFADNSAYLFPTC